MRLCAAPARPERAWRHGARGGRRTAQRGGSRASVRSGCFYPLFRGTLLRLADEEHILLLTQHHIISDGWSIGVLVQEVRTLYSAFCQGQSDPLPPLALQYADYAQWQRGWLQGEALEQHLAFWKQHLGGAPTVLELPTDRARSGNPSYAA
ncbi:condensation domain-containing protein [Massilia sp. H-1]|nr:condensation domain-containing protein [Massilia sp. H-1]